MHRRYLVSICRGARRTYCSALSRCSPESFARYSTTCSAEGVVSTPLNFGGRPVHITWATSWALAHSDKPGIKVGEGWPTDHLQTCFSTFFSRMPSRRRRASTAEARSADSMTAHREGTSSPVSTSTSVIRPSCDCLANSAGINGPSSNHWPRIEKPFGSQIREPHPRQTMRANVPPLRPGRWLAELESSAQDAHRYRGELTPADCADKAQRPKVSDFPP